MRRPELVARWRRAEELVRAADGVAYLATSAADVFYLTGFEGSNGWALVSDAGALLVTDGRYRDQAAEQAPDAVVVIAERGLVRALAASLGQSPVPGGGAICVDPATLSWAAATALAATVEVAVRSTPGISAQLRQIKTTAERDRIAEALALTESVLEETVAWMRPGMTEREVAAWFDYRCRASGADGMAFETIVAAHGNGALPHARPGARPLQAGDVVVFDCGARLAGYCADITRAVVVGDAPEWFTPTWRAVRAANEAALATIAPGVTCRQVDATARAVLAKAGLAEAFTHGLGHGVGVEIHESPRLSSTSDETLQAGMVVTVEPGVYLPGRGGVRLEDMVWVTENGAQRLNRLSLEPLHVAVG